MNFYAPYRTPAETARVRVMVPPAPIVTPTALTGGYANNDATMIAKIAAVTEEIDGPGGWLGRSLGPQTLRAELAYWPLFRFKLPYGPVISITSVKYTDEAGVSQTLNGGLWGAKNEFFWMKDGTWPKLADEPYPIQITYRAGYDGNDPLAGGTGPVPERARQAIILSTQNIVATGMDNLFVKVEEVEGVGRTEYVVSDQAGKIVHSACERLLSTLRVY